MVALNDHISKEMNELNLIRCQHIPKRPGADWRDLPDEKVKLCPLTSISCLLLFKYCVCFSPLLNSLAT